MKNISNAANNINEYTPNEIELLREKNPRQHALVMAKLKILAKEILDSQPKPSIMEFDDFI